VYVTSPTYKSIEVSGSSDIIGQTKVTSTRRSFTGSQWCRGYKMEVDAKNYSRAFPDQVLLISKVRPRDLDINLTGAVMLIVMTVDRKYNSRYIGGWKRPGLCKC
jgi:hypothetical protein